MRSAVAFLLSALALRAEVVITPSKQVTATSGTTVHFKANAQVTWSLLPGSAGSIDQNGDYHAPANIEVNDNLAGCQLLPNDHVLNTRIDSLPVSAKSADWMARMPAGPLRFSPSWGINIGDNATPVHSMHFLYTPDYDGKYQIPAWPNLKRESGVFSDPLSGADRHVVTINHETCTVSEIYNNYDPGVNPQCPTCNAQSGIRYGAMSYTLPAVSTDAAGLFLAPLTLRLDEIQSGAIKHALRVTLRNNFISPTSAWPSNAHAGAWGFIPYGSRFRLKASYDISHFSPLAKVLLTELKEYGLLIADGGLDWDIQASTDVLEDYDVQMALNELAATGPRSNDLEAVDESGLMISSSSGRINPHNRFAKPRMFAVVVATDSRDSSKSVEVPVGLQGVTVGVPEPAIWIQSNVKKQLLAWVNGTPNKLLLWSVGPKLGGITPEGVYSAPKVDRPTTGTITVASAADPNSKTSIAVTVLPEGPIRIDVGSAPQMGGTPNKHAPDYGPDAEGHMWWRDQAAESSGGAKLEFLSGSGWPRNPDVGLYYTARYAFGDMTYRFLVANGNYKITLLMAKPDCTGHFDPALLAPVYLEAQSQLILRNFDFGESINHQCLRPVEESLPAAVTDNWLTFSLRSGIDKTHRGITLLNAFVVSPDADPPHLSVAPMTDSLVTGEQRQFYAIRWFARGDIQWSLSGPGSLSPDGLYKSPLKPGLKDETVRVQARIQGESAIAATAAFTLKPGELTIAPTSETVVRSLSKKFKATFGALDYTNLNWSVTPAIGTIDANGTYTAPDELAQDTRVTVHAQSRDDPKKVASANLLVKAAMEPIRIRCGGGPGFKDAKGNYWSTDYGYSTDTIGYGMPIRIAGSTPDMQPLYQYSRYRYVDQPFNFHFDIPNGRYAVILKFADYAHDEAGNYSFDVGINGKKVLSNFDPDSISGPKTAIDKKFDVTVSNRQIRIDFLAHKGAAFINGIEIVPIAP
jgi:hypothetical protein